MPKNFTKTYAERLNQLCRLEVREASCHDVIRPGQVLIAPGGLQTRLERKGIREVRLNVEEGPADARYRPCIDISLASVAECFPGRALGVILTGMGNDGREGVRAIKAKGGKVIVQDEESCVVYGMPKAVIEAGLSDKVVPLGNMAEEILNLI